MLQTKPFSKKRVLHRPMEAILEFFCPKEPKVVFKDNISRLALTDKELMHLLIIYIGGVVAFNRSILK